jgi:hypothetical protein
MGRRLGLTPMARGAVNRARRAIAHQFQTKTPSLNIAGLTAVETLAAGSAN